MAGATRGACSLSRYDLVPPGVFSPFHRSCALPFNPPLFSSFPTSQFFPVSFLSLAFFPLLVLVSFSLFSLNFPFVFLVFFLCSALLVLVYLLCFSGSAGTFYIISAQP